MLEQLYKASWVESKARFAFLLGFSYSVIGITSALMLFPQDPGLASVAFTALLLLPSLNKMLSIEEEQVAEEYEFSLLTPFRDHADIFRVYFFLFLGIMLSYALFALLMPSLAASRIFEQQIKAVGLVGQAVAIQSGIALTSILLNNLTVLAFSILASLVYGSGAIFILTWMASVWGTIIALVAKNSAAVAHQNPIVYFIVTVVLMLPHTILEAATYFTAVIAGGVLSKAAVREKAFSERFNKIALDAAIIFAFAFVLLVISALVEVYVTKTAVNLFRTR